MAAESPLPSVTYRPIGVIRSPFTTPEGMPLQSVAAADVHGQIVLAPELAPAVADLDGFSHVHVVAHLHRGVPGGLTVVPFLDDTPRGVLATRSPRHPNPIGLSVVRLLAVDGATLEVAGLDLLDGTPVLDIKPYVPAFDAFEAERTGWLATAAQRVHQVRADARFREPKGP
ncbi:MAG TPA: tRNA (N6-threonylcarbamoyladenosine(37)-N6)-methyltransferase TrmO [Solirubrobacteraceae bacterium]|jgi:tRNA-Thr(GGU) m(6)t(6)A37 methyltransferase TsaA|nr:tRNA (N6-threonylcarbamoyladenosine(37)-N6)-methyltransferase TrmO [Solirubrobacteraceae bacterium]